MNIMKTSDLIEKLKDIRRRHGDLPVIDRDGEPVGQVFALDDQTVAVAPHSSRTAVEVLIE